MIGRENFIYVKERRFVFAYVPKVACTNWKALLRYLAVKGTGEWQRQYFHTIFCAIDEYRQRSRHSSTVVSFGVFQDWLAHSGDPFVADEHWLAQTRILSPSTVNCDFVGRFERLEQDADILIRRMGCDIAFPTREQIEFPGTNASDLLCEYYADVALELVRTIYGQDFGSFGYSLQAPGR